MSKHGSGARALAPVVLVVDDDRAYQRAVGDLLADAGYATLAAYDGLQALTLLVRAPRPAAIVLDRMMPGLDGFAVLAAIRADRATADVPVVFASASLLPDEDVPGATAVLHKPFEPEALVALLEQICRPAVSARAAG